MLISKRDFLLLASHVLIVCMYLKGDIKLCELPIPTIKSFIKVNNPYLVKRIRQNELERTVIEYNNRVDI